jgi:hypothetical protein
MASTPVEVKKATPTPTPMPDVWRSFRGEMDRLLDRFSTGFGMPSLRRMFEMEPAWRFESSFNFAAPAIDVSEDEKAYNIRSVQSCRALRQRTSMSRSSGTRL